jgi:hypothetical protein
VELRLGDDFHLEADEADILIRLGGGSVLWQKERLLNLALRGSISWLVESPQNVNSPR